MSLLAVSMMLLLPTVHAQDDDCGVGDAPVADDIELILDGTDLADVSPLPQGELLQAGDWIQVQGWSSGGTLGFNVSSNSGRSVSEYSDYDGLHGYYVATADGVTSFGVEVLREDIRLAEYETGWAMTWIGRGDGTVPDEGLPATAKPVERVQDWFTNRQRMLLNMHGINSSSLNEQTARGLADLLDKLEAMSRGRELDELAGRIGDISVTTTSGVDPTTGVQTARYEVADGDSKLVFEARFDEKAKHASYGMTYEDANGKLAGALNAAMSFSVEMGPGVPAANPVGSYLSSNPWGGYDTDDFSDLLKREAEEGLESALEGAILGDFGDNSSYSATGGQLVVGLIPIAGQVADGRDIIAATGKVIDGEEGAWAVLGINVVAVIPGLDFLKGGKSTVKKTVKTVLKDKATGVGRSIVLGQVKGAAVNALSTLTNDEAKRAAARLSQLAFTRADLLRDMQELLVDESIPQSTKDTARQVRNALQDQLGHENLAGAFRQSLGLPPSGGGRWRHDHLSEVAEGWSILKNSGLSDLLSQEQSNHRRRSDQYKFLDLEKSALERFDRVMGLYFDLE